MLDTGYLSYVLSAPSDDVFFVYVDWTTEEIPRPYYVGKGLFARVACERRNKLHKRQQKYFGLNRKIALITRDEELALSYENHLIQIHRTFHRASNYNGIGCNFTTGGEGISGFKHSQTTKEKIRAKCKGRKHTPEEILKQKLSQAGKSFSALERLKRKENNKFKKKVHQLSDTKEIINTWESVKEVKRHFGDIYYALRYGKKSRGFYWSYA